MFNSPILDLVIGMLFVFLLMSVLSSAVKELFAQAVNMRAIVLARAIKHLLQDPSGEGLSADFYRHPLIKVLFEPRTAWWQRALDRFLPAPGKPDNIPPETFAAVLSDLVEDSAVQGLLVLRDRALAGGFGEDEAAVLEAVEKARALVHEDHLAAVAQIETLQGIVDKVPELDEKLNLSPMLTAIEAELTGSSPRSAIGLSTAVVNLANRPLRRTFQMLIQQAKGDVDQFQAALVAWFNDGMDKATDLYKRWAQVAIFAVGLALSIALNVDTLTVTKNLWKDKHLRDTVVASAGRYATPMADAQGHATNGDEGGGTVATLRGMDLPFGWDLNSQAKGWWDALMQSYSTQNGGRWGLTWLGWLLTAFAASLGAPFWFDSMAKLLNFRGSLNKQGD